MHIIIIIIPFFIRQLLMKTFQEHDYMYLLYVTNFHATQFSIENHNFGVDLCMFKKP